MSVPHRLPPVRRGPSRALALLPLGMAIGALAQEGAPPPAPAASAASQAVAAQRVTVTGTAVRDEGPFAARSSKAQLARTRAASSDSARLLQDVPGVSLYGAGGVSSLPVIHGLADDRLRTQVDGMDLMAACPNHMNPVLSYIDPSNVGTVKVYAGISPVSVGGDSIGGTIQVEAAKLEFALAGEPALQKGQLSAFYRSNGAAHGGSLSATLATDTLNFGFTAATTRQNNFRAARAFKPAEPGSEAGRVIPGDEVGSSAYQSNNQELRAAWRDNNHLLQLSLARQQIGFEAFPNQRMDMTGQSQHPGQPALFTGRFDWGELLARAYQQKVSHEMDMGPDRYLLRLRHADGHRRHHARRAPCSVNLETWSTATTLAPGGRGASPTCCTTGGRRSAVRWDRTRLLERRPWPAHPSADTFAEWERDLEHRSGSRRPACASGAW